MHGATRWSILLTVGIAVSIAVGTLAPPTAAEQAPGSDKFYHVFAFLVLAFPLGMAQPRWSPGLFLLFSAFGAAIELIQPYVGRSREMADLVADMAGILVGLVLGWGAARAWHVLSAAETTQHTNQTPSGPGPA